MKKITALIFVFMAMFIWGTSFLVMKNTLDNINAGFMIFLRGFIAMVILLPFFIKHFKDFKKKDLLFIAFTGSIVCAGYLVQAIGLNYTTPAKSAFLEDAYCIIVPLLTCILTKKKPTLLNIICVILCVAGVVLISIESFDGTFNIGDVLSVTAGMLFGINITLTGLYARKYDAISYTAGQFIIITIISAIYTFVFEDNKGISFNASSVFQVLYLGIVVTALAWVFRNIGQRVLSPLTISIILPFSAVVSTILSVFAKEDTLTIYLIIGGVLITLSILLDTILPNRKKAV